MRSERENQPPVLRGNRSSDRQNRDVEVGGMASTVRHREERKAALSKVVIRRLPPSISKEQLEEQLHPLPAHDYFEFFTADPRHSIVKNAKATQYSERNQRCPVKAILYPHLFSRAYINFRNPEDILLFRDRFDGFIFIDNKGQEFPAVVEFAPFQKIAKKKLKKKDAKAGSIAEDIEYKKFLENYCADEEKICANPETLLGEIEAKTKELIARRTTPLLEFIKNRKLEKQRIREEKREDRRRRELEKKRLREEEKRKRREEERRKRKEADKQKKLCEKEIRIKLLKKPEKGDDIINEKQKEKIEEIEQEETKWEKSSSGSIKMRTFDHFVKELKEKTQNESDKEQRDNDRRFRDKEQERQKYQRMEDGRKSRTHFEFEKFIRRNEDDQKWGKAYNQDRVKKGSHSNNFTGDSVDKLGKEDKCDDMTSKKERIRNKDRTAMQLYQPGARNRITTGFASKYVEEAHYRKDDADNSSERHSEKNEDAG